MEMNGIVNYKAYEQPPFCEKEILRYAGCKEADEKTLELMKSCISEAKEQLSYKVCYRELRVNIKDDLCDFGIFSIRSEKLAKNLCGCEKVILFAATVGTGIDRLIMKYSRISPAKALMLQAIGAERIEALCDAFCEDIKGKMGMKPRFSPGYGDLPIETQKDIFSVLDTERKIGLFLNDSLIMSPSKSVTAFAGICETECKNENKCTGCTKKDCLFRGEL